VFVRFLVTPANMIGGTVRHISTAFRQGMLVDMTVMHMVQMTVMQIIYMIVVLYRFVSAIAAVLVIVCVVRIAVHVTLFSGTSDANTPILIPAVTFVNLQATASEVRRSKHCCQRVCSVCPTLQNMKIVATVFIFRP